MLQGVGGGSVSSPLKVWVATCMQGTPRRVKLASSTTRCRVPPFYHEPEVIRAIAVGGQSVCCRAGREALTGDHSRDGLEGAQSEVVRAIWCSGARVLHQSEVIRAITEEDSPRCGGPAPGLGRCRAPAPAC